MLTDEEFLLRLEEKEEREEKRRQAYSKYYMPNASKKREKRTMSKRETSKKRTNAVVAFELDTSYHRSEYENYLDNSTIKTRIRNLKEYYVIEGLTVQELKQFELDQMLEHYNGYKKLTRKCFNRFLKSYVVVDYELMLELIKIVTETSQQAYKMRIQWERALEEKRISDSSCNLMQQIDQLSKRDIEHIKGMYLYNKKISVS